MSLNKNKPITYEMTPSAAKAVNSTLSNGFFTPVTGVEEQEGINAWEPLEASTSTGYLPDVTSREGQSLINKWAGKALIGSMTPEQIEALPRDYSKRVKDRIRTKGLVGEINRGQNTFANKAFEWGVPTMLSIAGLGPTVSLASNVGWLPTAGILGGEIAGSYGLSTGLGWLGKQIDERNRTNGEYSNYEAIGGLIGGIGGGILGGGLGYKGTVKLGSKGLLPKGDKFMYGSQFVGDVAEDALTRQLKKAPSKTIMDYYRDYNFLFSELTDPDRFVHVSPNPISGKNVSVGAAHSNGVNWVPGNAHVSKVGDDNMVWLWTGKPYRNRSSDQTFISIPKTEGMVQTRQPGAVGVPQIDLTHNTTKIITKNPITGGFERQLVVSPAQPSKGSYAFFERPSKLTEANRLKVVKQVYDRLLKAKNNE